MMYTWHAISVVWMNYCCCFSVAKLYPTRCDPNGLQHARIPSFTISQSLFKVVSIESEMPSDHLLLCHHFCPQPSASVSFPMSCFFISGGQSIGASASVSPMNIQGWLPLGLTSLISLLSRG